MSERMPLGRNDGSSRLGASARWSTVPRPTGVPFVYDRKTIALHWCTAVLVAALWIIAQIIDDFPAGPLRVDARSVHISFGIVLAVVLAIRVIWRIRGASALYPDREGGLNRLAALGHWSLYTLAIVAALLGMANALVRGDSLFNLFTLPDLAHGDRDIRKFMGSLHGWVANTLVVLALGHVILALFHHYVLGDSVMRRMLPGFFSRNVPSPERRRVSGIGTEPR